MTCWTPPGTPSALRSPRSNAPRSRGSAWRWRARSSRVPGATAERGAGAARRRAEHGQPAARRHADRRAPREIAGDWIDAIRGADRAASRERSRPGVRRARAREGAGARGTPRRSSTPAGGGVVPDDLLEREAELRRLALSLQDDGAAGAGSQAYRIERLTDVRGQLRDVEDRIAAFAPEYIRRRRGVPATPAEIWHASATATNRRGRRLVLRGSGRDDGVRPGPRRATWRLSVRCRPRRARSARRLDAACLQRRRRGLSADPAQPPVGPGRAGLGRARSAAARLHRATRRGRDDRASRPMDPCTCSRCTRSGCRTGASLPALRRQLHPHADDARAPARGPRTARGRPG